MAMPADNKSEQHYSNSNFLSKAVFWWTTGIYEKASKSLLCGKDFDSQFDELRDSTISNRIALKAETDSLLFKCRSSFIRTLISENLSHYLMIVCFSVIFCLIYILKVLSLWRILSYFENRFEFNITLWGVLFIVSTISFDLLINQGIFQERKLYSKLQIQMSTLIYYRLTRRITNLNDLTSEGEIMNLIQSDIPNIALGVSCSPHFIFCTLTIISFSFFLASLYRLHCLFFFIIILIITGVSFYLNHKKYDFYISFMEAKDKRLKATHNFLTNIKFIKLLSWERLIVEKLELLRHTELVAKFKDISTTIFTDSLFTIMIGLLFIVTVYIEYYFESKLSSVRIFTAFFIFESLREVIGYFQTIIVASIESLASTERINHFLNIKEYVDCNESIELNSQDLNSSRQTFDMQTSFNTELIAIEIKNMNFYLERPHISNSISENAELLGKQKPCLQIIDLKIKKNEMVAVVGKPGSGKSIFLKAILNSLHRKNKEVDYSFKVSGSIGSFLQIPWIQENTFKENILLTKEFDKDLYEQVIKCCELDEDRSNLVGKDLEFLGEKGINISFGQKVRINLARELYAETSILLLDNINACLDSIVSTQILTNLKGMNKKTRIMIINEVKYLPEFDRIFSIHEGEIVFNGSYQEYLESNNYENLQAEVCRDAKMKNQTETFADDDELDLDIDYQNITCSYMDHDINEEGNIDLSVYTFLFDNKKAKFLGILIILTSIFWEGCRIASYIWLMKSIENENNKSDFTIYSLLVFGTFIFLSLTHILTVYCSIIIIRHMHKKMIEKIVQAPVNDFHNKKTKAFIINRLNKDLDQVIDVVINDSAICKMICNLITILILFWYTFILVLAFIPLCAFLLYLIIRTYACSGRELARIEGSAYSDYMHYVNEIVSGAIYINLHNCHDHFLHELNSRLYRISQISIFNTGCFCWTEVNSVLIGWLIDMFIIVSILTSKSIKPEMVGLLLSYSYSFNWILDSLSIKLVNTHILFISVERCLSLTKIKTEKDLAENCFDEIDQEWPQNGKIEFVDVIPKILSIKLILHANSLPCLNYL